MLSLLRWQSCCDWFSLFFPSLLKVGADQMLQLFLLLHHSAAVAILCHYNLLGLLVLVLEGLLELTVSSQTLI